MKRFELVVEDELSEAVLRQLLSECGFVDGYCYRKGGYGYIKKHIGKFNQAAAQTPYFVLTDLDRYSCASELKLDWLPVSQHQNLLFRVAVREVESWVLADRAGFARFLGISFTRIPSRTDDIEKPKEFLIDLAKHARNRQLRDALIPKPDGTAKVGPDYNGRLSDFVFTEWNIQTAATHSNSLSRAIRALKNFQPTR